MTAWVAGVFSDEDKQRFDARTDLRRNERFAGKGFWGPSPDDLNAVVPDLLKGVKLTNTPGDGKSNDAGAIGQNATFWVPNPNDPDKGIWGLAATGGGHVDIAIKAGAPVVWGYYARLTTKFPLMSKVSALHFQDGALDTFYKYYPNQKPVDLRTFEVVGLMNGSPVPLNSILQRVQIPGTAGTSENDFNYIMAAGASIAVGDAEEDGFNLAGHPGKWNDYYGTTSPTQWGLDRDKGVLFWDGSRGQVLSATILTNWYGPTWRSVVYTASGS